MNRTTKRFLFPIIFFVIIFFYLLLVPDEYTDLNGLISTIVVLIVLPLFLITLIWAILGGVNDHRLRAQGIEPGNELLPSLRKAKTAIEEDRKEGQALPADLKKRRIRFRLGGGALAVFGLVLACIDHYVIGTLILIGGCTLFITSTPSTYSKNVDGISMLECPPEYTLDRIYEDFREYRTIFGSVFRGTTFPHNPALFWKAPDSDVLFYLYKPQGKNFLYIGCSADIGCKQLSDPLYPAESFHSDQFQDALCYNLEYHNFSEDLSEVFRSYLKTGQILPMPEYRKGTVYFFEENFKLTGQHFRLYNGAKEPVYEVDGIYPLKTLRIFDMNQNEIFRVTKELVHAMPHYLFYDGSMLIGEFSKNFDLMRDSFSMKTTEGLLEMTEINILAGDNYILTLNGKRIGMIAERLNLSLENLVFDNMVLTVYEEKYLPLVTALGIMAAREMARDEAKSN